MNEAQQLQHTLGIIDEAEGDKGNGGGKANVQKVIKALINTKFSGSNEEQGKAVQLLRGLAFSDDPVSNKFMQKLDTFTSSLDPKDFE